MKKGCPGSRSGRRSEYYLGCLFSLCGVSCFLSRSARTRSSARPAAAETPPTMRFRAAVVVAVGP